MFGERGDGGESGFSPSNANGFHFHSIHLRARGNLHEKRREIEGRRRGPRLFVLSLSGFHSPSSRLIEFVTRACSRNRLAQAFEENIVELVTEKILKILY